MLLYFSQHFCMVSYNLAFNYSLGCKSMVLINERLGWFVYSSIHFISVSLLILFCSAAFGLYPLPCPLTSGYYCIISSRRAVKQSSSIYSGEKNTEANEPEREGKSQVFISGCCLGV